MRFNLRQENFSIFDIEISDNNRIVLFLSKTQTEVLKKSKEWLVDCTYQSVPRPFYKLLTIHAEYIDSFYPLCHALMTNKSKQHMKKSLKK